MAESDVKEQVKQQIPRTSFFQKIGKVFSNIDEWAIKNAKILGIVAGAIVLGIAGYFLWDYYRQGQNEQAQKEMATAQNYFSIDSLDLALKGDKTSKGFLDIKEEYSGTKAGKLASFYIGAIKLRQGKFDEAIAALDDFSASDVNLQARAYSLMGDAYMEKKDFANAATYYGKATNYSPSTEQFTPGYLMKLGLASELNKDMEGAKNAYKRIIADFPKSALVEEAKRNKAKIEVTAGGTAESN